MPNYLPRKNEEVTLRNGKKGTVTYVIFSSASGKPYRFAVKFKNGDVEVFDHEGFEWPKFYINQLRNK